MPHLELFVSPRRLDSARIFLRPYRVDDAPWYCEMAQRNRTHLAEHESGNPIFGIHCETDAAAVLLSFDKRWQERTAFAFGVFLRETEEFAGQIYLGTTDAALPSFNLGFFADYAHVNRGYITEGVRMVLAFAFGDLGAHRIGLWCDEANRNSQRVAERCGFVREGHVREDKRHPDGSVTGSFCYGLLRDEFRP